MKLLIINFILCGLIISGCKEENIVIETPGYAIGAIYEYNSGSTGIRPRVGFDYEVNSIKYHNRYAYGDHGWDVPGAKDYKTGDMFMVQYDLDNISTARMLFDYPVKDSIDYMRYIEEFKTNPPPK